MKQFFSGTLREEKLSVDRPDHRLGAKTVHKPIFSPLSIIRDALSSEYIHFLVFNYTVSMTLTTHPGGVFIALLSEKVHQTI